MTDLSPAAESVLNAVTLKRYDVSYYACPKSIDQIKSDVAAALRAAADQVVPLPRLPYDSCCDVHAAAIRAELFAIAAELEGQ
jgi:hypothetical protein